MGMIKFIQGKLNQENLDKMGVSILDFFGDSMGSYMYWQKKVFRISI